MGKIIKQQKKLFFIPLFFLVSCASIILPVSEHHIYLKSRVAIQSTKFNFLGSVEIYSHPQQFVFSLKDSLFRPLIKFTITEKNIIITQNKKSKKFAARKNNKAKILGLDFTPIEFYSILQARIIQGAERLIFSDTLATPENVQKKTNNNIIQVYYLAWQEKQGRLVPKRVKIASKNPQVLIHLVITDYQTSF